MADHSHLKFQQLIKTTILQNFASAQVFIFGSRAKNRAEQYSDLDIAIDNQVPLDLAKLALLKEQLAQSNIPFQVDIVDWQRISDEFKKNIKPDLIKI